MLHGIAHRKEDVQRATMSNVLCVKGQTAEPPKQEPLSCRPSGDCEKPALSIDEIAHGGVKNADFSPVVIAEVKKGDGGWTRAKCFLDGGSNSSLIRTKFAKDVCLRGSGPCSIQLGVAGGGLHREERSEEFEIEIRPVNGKKSYFMMLTGIRKPCFNIRPVSREIFKRHAHLQSMEDKLYVDGGEIDILIGRDYASLIADEDSLRAPVNPDNSPPVTVTR